MYIDPYDNCCVKKNIGPDYVNRACIGYIQDKTKRWWQNNTKRYCHIFSDHKFKHKYVRTYLFSRVIMVP